MIEFIIPQNLPVRAVEITDVTASPPPYILQEMNRWAMAQLRGAGSGSNSAASDSANTDQIDHAAQSRELELQLESLRQQQGLFSQATMELQRATGNLQQQLDGMIRELQEVTVELAQSIAAKLIFDEVDNDRFPIANLVHEVIGRLDSHAEAVVRLHPDDLAIIEQYPMIEGSDIQNPLRFVGDSTLSRGDCHAKAGEISVIYELRRQIDEIRRELLSTVSGHAET